LLNPTKGTSSRHHPTANQLTKDEVVELFVGAVGMAAVEEEEEVVVITVTIT
jgi:hypothetical protein